MSDDLESAPPPPWAPSPRLRRQLRVGISAAVVSCVLGTVAAASQIAAGPQPGATAAVTFEWAALVVLWWVFVAYAALGREAESRSLERSARCVFVAAVAVALHDLAEKRLFGGAGQVTVWIAFGACTIALLVMPFVGGAPSQSLTEETEGDTAATEVTAGAKAGAVGAAAIGLAIAAKVAFKAIAKVAAVKAVGRMVKNLNLDWEAVSLGVVLVIGGLALLWFAIAKIRLRHRLGGVMAVAGWAEIVGVIAILGVAASFAVDLAVAIDQPGLNPQDAAALEATFDRKVAALGIATDILWTGLTVWVFGVLRTRGDGDSESTMVA